MRSLRSLLVVTVLGCIVVVAGCSARPVPAPEALPGSDLSPPGSELLSSLDASDSAVVLRLQRLAPGPSGDSTVNVWWGLSTGEDNQAIPALVGAGGPDLAFDAVASSGSLVAHLAGRQALASLKRPVGVHGGASSEQEELSFVVPRQARWLRVTAHVGLTKQQAARGYTTRIPISSIPAVSSLNHALGSHME
jgi:hypothetical protein